MVIVRTVAYTPSIWGKNESFFPVPSVVFCRSSRQQKYHRDGVLTLESASTSVARTLVKMGERGRHRHKRTIRFMSVARLDVYCMYPSQLQYRR